MISKNNMEIAFLIYNEYESIRNKFFIDVLIKECKKYDINLILLIEEKLDILIENNKLVIKYDSKILDTPKFVICRTMNYVLAKQFELMGIRVFNKSSISLMANNKYLSYINISSLGIKTLDTLYKTKNVKTKNVQFPLVTKPLDEKGGKEVNLNNNIDDYNKSLQYYENKCFVEQKVVKDIGKDLRVYVIGKNIITSILRTSNSGFKSNYCLGGSAKVYNINDEEKKVVYKIINEFDFDYVGIDFLFEDGEMIFNEIEDVVGARMVYDLTDINIGKLYIEHIINALK